MATIVDRYIIGVELKGGKTVQRDINAMAKSSRKGITALGALRAALVVVASAAILGRLLKTADTLTELQNRLRLVTRNQRELIAVQNSLFQISQRTRTSFEANILVFQRLAQSTTGLGFRYKDLLEITELVGLATLLSGSSADTAAAGLRQFAQGLASGAIQGDELTSVVENLPRLAASVAKELGIAAGALKTFNRATPGAITVGVVLRGLKKDAKALGLEFETTQKTIGQGFQVLANAALLFTGSLSLSSGAGRFLADTMITLADNIHLVAAAIVALLGVFLLSFAIKQVIGLVRVIAFLGLTSKKSLGILRLVLLAVASPLRLLAALGRGVIVVFSIIPRVLIAIRTAVVGLRAAFLALRFAMVSATAAGTLLAAAVASPLLIGIAVVAALVGAFFFFREDIKKTIDVMGGFTGIFNTVATNGFVFFRLLFTQFDLFTRAAKEKMIDFGNGIKIGYGSVSDSIKGFFSGILRDTAEFINEGIRLVNKLISAGNKALPEKFAANLLPEIDVSKFGFSPTDIGDITNEYAGAGEAFAKAYQDGVSGILEKGGPTEIIKEKLSDLLAKLKEFGGIDFVIDSAALEALALDAEKTRLELDKADKAAQAAKRALDGLLSSISPLLAAEIKLAKAQKIINDAIENGVKISGQAIDKDTLSVLVKRRLTREIVGVGNALIELEEKQLLANKAFDAGIISAQELAKRMRELKLEFLADDKSFTGGIERGLLKVGDMFRDLASITEEVMTDAFGGIEDGLISLIRTGNANLSEFVNGIADDITKLFVRSQITQPLFEKFAAGKEGGIAGAIGKLFGEKPAAADKAKNIVPGNLIVQGNIVTGKGPLGAAGLLGVTDEIAGEGKAGDALQEAIKGPFDSFVDRISGVFSGLKDGLGNMFSKLPFDLGGLFSGLTSGLGGIFGSLTSGLGGILSSVLGGLGGAGGGIASTLIGIGASLFGFAKGGSFDVGGTGGIDSQIVAFKASPNERVSVETPQQQRANGGGQAVVTEIHHHKTIIQVSTPDVAGFDRNQGQITARIDAQNERARRRNR